MNTYLNSMILKMSKFITNMHNAASTTLLFILLRIVTIILHRWCFDSGNIKAS